MRNILAMAGKEIRAYFHSPIAYLVMTVYTAPLRFCVLQFGRVFSARVLPYANARRGAAIAESQ